MVIHGVNSLRGKYPNAMSGIHFVQLVEKGRAIKTLSVTETAWMTTELCCPTHRVINVEQGGNEKY